jgi:hypothetical protein
MLKRQNIDDIGNDYFNSQYDFYLQERQKINIDPKIDNNYLSIEFIVKCKFLLHKYSGNLLSYSIYYMAGVLNKEKGFSFNKEFSGDLFDGFMHFLASTKEIHNAEITKKLMDTWVKQGRDLEETIEVSKNTLTPCDIAISKDDPNIDFIINLYEHKVDILKPDKSGFNALHILLLKILDGKTSISILENWVAAGLPTDITTDQKIHTSCIEKKPVELAEMLGMIKATDILGGDTKIAEDNFHALSEVKDYYEREINTIPNNNGDDIEEIIVTHVFHEQSINESEAFLIGNS